MYSRSRFHTYRRAKKRHYSAIRLIKGTNKFKSLASSWPPSLFGRCRLALCSCHQFTSAILPFLPLPCTALCCTSHVHVRLYWSVRLHHRHFVACCYFVGAIFVDIFFSSHLLAQLERCALSVVYFINVVLKALDR